MYAPDPIWHNTARLYNCWSILSGHSNSEVEMFESSILLLISRDANFLEFWCKLLSKNNPLFYKPDHSILYFDGYHHNCQFDEFLAPIYWGVSDHCIKEQEEIEVLHWFQGEEHLKKVKPPCVVQFTQFKVTAFWIEAKWPHRSKSTDGESSIDISIYQWRQFSASICTQVFSAIQWTS